MAERSHELSGLQNGVIGSLAGMIEVILQQPTISIKNAIQQNRPISWSPPVLYRGVGVSLGSIAPISAVQFAINGMVLTHLSKKNEPLSDQEKITAAAFAGVLSALLSSPAELVMTLQQNSGKSFGATVSEVASNHGVLRLFRGLEVTATREALWCASYLALGPVITHKLHLYTPSIFGSEEEATLSQKASASICGSVLAGLATVYSTQPLDTVKTVMQGQAITVSNPRSSIGVAMEMWQKEGLKAFYRGSAPRGIRLINGVFILGQSRNYLEELFIEKEILKFN